MARSDKLNRYLVTRHFKMESIRTAKRLIQMGDWLVKLDSKDAYFTVPIHPSHQKISQALVAGPDMGIQSPTVWCSIHLFDSSVHTEEAGIQIDLLLRQYADIGKNQGEAAGRHLATAMELLVALGFIINLSWNFMFSC